MPDELCVEACKAAYGSCVGNCNQVLLDCLATASSEEEREQCRTRFKKCMELCKEARQACLETCKD